jgi:hypothetical protein
MRKGITNRETYCPGNGHRTPAGVPCTYNENLRAWIAMDPTWDDKYRYNYIPDSHVTEIA